MEITVSTINQISGDFKFNGPGVNGSLINPYVSAPFHERLIEIANDLHLDQIIQVPTRGLNILDLGHYLLESCFSSAARICFSQPHFSPLL